MSGEQNSSHGRSRHLDQLPKEKHVTAWERAVVDRARWKALLRRRIRNAEWKEEEFWKTFNAYEASEISKRRQNRRKQSPTKLEKYEKLDEERYERNVRHGISDEINSEERLKKRAERFGLEASGVGKMVTTTNAFGKTLADYADTMEKLERRRIRFAMEPRHDGEYDVGWRSDLVAYLDEDRKHARMQRFSKDESLEREAEAADDGRGMQTWECRGQSW